MEAKDRRTELRAAVNRGDGLAVVGLAERWLGSDDALQLLGDGLLAALAHHVGEAPKLAAECARRLRQRGWDGDDDLADQLDAGAGVRAHPMLRPLPVDLEELAMLLEGDGFGGGGRIDRQTGEIWTEAAIEYAEEQGEDLDTDDEDRWLWVGPEGSADGYRDMQAFIATVTDPSRADRLEIAIDGNGAFRRFKDVLGRWPEELERWFAYSEERQRGRARTWLTDAGYYPSPGPGSSPRQ